jgi:hypothetical protein
VTTIVIDSEDFICNTAPLDIKVGQRHIKQQLQPQHQFPRGIQEHETYDYYSLGGLNLSKNIVSLVLPSFSRSHDHPHINLLSQTPTCLHYLQQGLSTEM